MIPKFVLCASGWVMVIFTGGGKSERARFEGFVENTASVWNILKHVRGGVKRQWAIQTRNTEDESGLEILTKPTICIVSVREEPETNARLPPLCSP